jgi:uncharacterized protein YpmB
MNKKIIIFLVLVGLVIGAYFLFFKKPATPTTTTTTTQTSTGLAGLASDINLGSLSSIL